MKLLRLYLLPSNGFHSLWGSQLDSLLALDFQRSPLSRQTLQKQCSIFLIPAGELASGLFLPSTWLLKDYKRNRKNDYFTGLASFKTCIFLVRMDMCTKGHGEAHGEGHGEYAFAVTKRRNCNHKIFPKSLSCP